MGADLSVPPIIWAPDTAIILLFEPEHSITGVFEFYERRIKDIVIGL